MPAIGSSAARTSTTIPAEAAALPDVATFDGVIMEQLVASDPDLVLAAGNGFNTPADIARIRELGIPVVVVYPEDVPGVLDDIELIGDAIGKGDEAAAMTGAMQARIDVISAATAAVEPAADVLRARRGARDLRPDRRLVRRRHGHARGW